MDEDTEQSPPEPKPDVPREGQSTARDLPIVYTGVPQSKGIAELPAILLEGAREAVHSELTWKLISKIASQGEDERAGLRAERDAARAGAEKWRGHFEEVSNELTGLRARWESVSTLTNAQSFLYVAGGVLMGPAVQDLVAGHWVAGTVFVAILGGAAIAAAYGLGKLGPRRKD